MTTSIIELQNQIPVAYIDREKLFLNENNEVKPLIEKVKEHYSSIAFEGIDGSTEEGRKRIKNLAAEINKFIKYIDNAGKEVTDILKAKPKKIDSARKLIRDELDKLYREVRKPVSDYEDEQARIKAEAEQKAFEEQRLKDEELARLKAAESKRLHEEQIRREAEAKAMRELEAKALQAELALERERQAALQKEAARLAAEQRAKDDEAKRVANVEHQRTIKNQAFHSLTANGIDRDVAIKLIQLISENKIENVFIKY